MRRVAGAQLVKPALPGTDDEGVPGGAAAEKVGPGPREVEAGLGAEGLAGAKPPQRVGREALANRLEPRPQRMKVGEREAIEGFAVDAREAPLAVAPVLDLADRPVGLDTGQPVERLGPARHAGERVEATEPSVQIPARPPAVAQTGPKAPAAAGLVVDHQAERTTHAPSLRPRAPAGKRRLDAAGRRPEHAP
jgi:hypothetical protein